jgi:catechol 2,3-dioxygenase-like lactoylglutathione lyase family enzyme
MLDHIGLRTKQFDALLAFYTAALEPLGYKIMIQYPGAAGLGRDYPYSGSVPTRRADPTSTWLSGRTTMLWSRPSMMPL